MAASDGRGLRARGSDVLFWAERDFAFYVGITGLSSLVIAPLAILEPSLFLVGLATLAFTGWLGWRTFRFELTADTLRWKANFWLPTLTIPLAHIAEASAQRGPLLPLVDTSRRSGTLRLRLTNGRSVDVPGLLGPEEAVQAIATLKARARPPAEPLDAAA